MIILRALSLFSMHCQCLLFLKSPRPPNPTLFPYTTLFRSESSVPPHTPRRIRPPPASPSICSARSGGGRSEEHTSELQSRFDLVCRLLLEKKNVAESTGRI